MEGSEALEDSLHERVMVRLCLRVGVTYGMTDVRKEFGARRGQNKKNSTK